MKSTPIIKTGSITANVLSKSDCCKAVIKVKNDISASIIHALIYINNMKRLIYPIDEVCQKYKYR